MLQLSIYTEKSKKCILRAINMTEECGYKYLEPQVLMAGIVNEGRDMLSYIMQFLHVDRIAFCKKINETIIDISDTSSEAPILSEKTQDILERAKVLSNERGCELIPLEFLLLSMILIPSKVKDVFSHFGIDEMKLAEAISLYRGNREIEFPARMEENNANYPNLEKYGRNLCTDAHNGIIHKAIGRDNEIRRIIHILSRQIKNNPILVGEPGTGKTAIIEGLAHRIVEGDLPRELRGIQLYSLNIASLIAGASHMGEFEERLRGVIDDVVKSEGSVVLFIDEIHLLIGEGRSGGAMDAANIMKPELARGKIKVIGATTFDEYKQYIEQDRAFERRFQKVAVDEPDIESAIAILRGIRLRLEDFHRIRIKDEAIRASVKLSMRYIQDRFLPDKAIDLLDESAAKMKIARYTSPIELDTLRRKITTKEIECESIKRDDESNPIVLRIQEEIANLKEEENSLHAKWQSERLLLEEIQIRRNEIARLNEDKILAESQGSASSVVNISLQIHELNDEIHHLMESLQENGSNNLLKPELDELDVMSVITEWTGIPLSKLSENETQKLAHIEEYLNQSVIGQDEAKILVANAIRRNKMGFSDANKPIGTFLFLGTTGVGKTELCKALSEYLFDSRDALIRIDMSEYQQEHEVSKLFGAPPGYIGFENGGQLTEAVRKKTYSIVLFDEIEKAHPKVFETLLQVLDEGRMTDGKGRTVNFKNTIIVMTSNLGHEIIYSTLQGKRFSARRRIGFNVSEEVNIPSDNNLVTEEKIVKAKNLILTELKSKVAPEFVNRIDDIIMFLPLSKDDIRKIVQLQLKALTKNMKSQGIDLRVSEDAVDFLVRVGFQPEYGARPVKRAINSYLIDDMCISIINGEISKNSPIQVSAEQNNLKFTNI
jgi:ATP-dependent Clp protease ATP-binding subunit ClpB